MYVFFIHLCVCVCVEKVNFLVFFCFFFEEHCLQVWLSAKLTVWSKFGTELLFGGLHNRNNRACRKQPLHPSCSPFCSSLRTSHNLLPFDKRGQTVTVGGEPGCDFFSLFFF